VAAPGRRLLPGGLGLANDEQSFVEIGYRCSCVRPSGIPGVRLRDAVASVSDHAKGDKSTRRPGAASRYPAPTGSPQGFAQQLAPSQQLQRESSENSTASSRQLRIVGQSPAVTFS
jgi:hypothetical protein